MRTVIHEAIADLDETTGEIVLTLHWVGGAHTEHRLPRRRRERRNSTPGIRAQGLRPVSRKSLDLSAPFAPAWAGRSGEPHQEICENRVR